MTYAIQVSNRDASTSFTFEIDSKFVVDGSINLMHTLKAYKLNASDLLGIGNTITFGTLENDNFKPLHAFREGM
jgi:hypothetical protein